jgi:CubicO group peptidase (beta-lactamase class C family)
LAYDSPTAACYVLLAMIVATVSGQSSAEFLKVRIFDPLGMKHTVAYDQSRPTRHKLAHGYLQETVRSMYDIAIAISVHVVVS